MKKIKYHLNESVIALLLVIILLLIMNPFGLLMLNMMQMSLVIVCAVLFLAFAGLIWKEDSHDEREELHRLRAGRYGYLAGLSIAVLGIVIQASQHAIDQWLVFTVAAMILGKVIAHVFNKKHS